MKKYILMVLCMACTTNLLAQKDMVVHKKDGTTLRIPTDVKHRIWFWGKNETSDGDYVFASDISGYRDVHSLFLRLNSKYVNTTNSTCGILWSETPGVNEENGKEAILTGTSTDNEMYVNNKPNDVVHYKLDNSNDISFDTPYYYRAYVERYGKRYYSEEKSHTFYQGISSFIGYTPEWDFEQSAYVMPTDTAFKIGFKEFTGIECSDTSLAVLKEEWQAYLTQDKAKELIAKDGELKKCHEGDLFHINEVGNDFFEALFTEGVFNIDIPNSINYENDYTKNCITPITAVECDESWGVKDNRYWIAMPVTRLVNPQVTFNMPHGLEGYTYKVSIVFAPDTEAEADSLATHNKVRLNYYASDEGGEFTTRTTIYVSGTKKRDFDIDNATRCDTVTVELTPKNLQKMMLEVISNVTSANLRKGYSREIRISGIYVERKKIEATEEETE